MTDDELLASGLRPMVVSRAHCVRADIPGSGRPDPDDPHRVIGTLTRTFRPGERVWLPPEDAQRLRDIGYVLDPERDAPIISEMFAPPRPHEPTYISAQAADGPREIRFER